MLKIMGGITSLVPRPSARISYCKRRTRAGPGNEARASLHFTSLVLASHSVHCFADVV